MKHLESVRQKAAIKMGFGDISQSISPKICIVSPPKNGGTIHSCYFTPFDCHTAHAVSGVLCLAAACLIKSTVANNVAQLPIPKDKKFEQNVAIEHASGKTMTSITADKSTHEIHFLAASSIRTARPLFEGPAIVSNAN